MELNAERLEKYDRRRMQFPSEAKRIRFVLDGLDERFGGKVAFFLDNLESVESYKVVPRDI
jgi:hypothetical protein